MFVYLCVCVCARTPDPLLWEVYVDIHAELLLFFVPAEKVTRIITFPEYDNKTHNNDIALMKLQKPLQMSGTKTYILIQIQCATVTIYIISKW